MVVLFGHSSAQVPDPDDLVDHIDPLKDLPMQHDPPKTFLGEEQDIVELHGVNYTFRKPPVRTVGMTIP